MKQQDFGKNFQKNLDFSKIKATAFLKVMCINI